MSTAVTGRWTDTLYPGFHRRVQVTIASASLTDINHGPECYQLLQTNEWCRSSTLECSSVAAIRYSGKVNMFFLTTLSGLNCVMMTHVTIFNQHWNLLCHSLMVGNDVCLMRKCWTDLVSAITRQKLLRLRVHPMISLRSSFIFISD